MSNNHHTSFGKQVLRALWEIFLSVGFGGFWIGLYIDSVLLLIASGTILLIGLVGSVRSFVRSNSNSRHRNNNRAYRRH